jgi:glucose/arabinose dehydrogenase
MTKRINLIFLTLILTISLISCDSNGGSSDTGNGNVRTNYTIVSAFPLLTFDRPLGIENAGDGTNRLFVVEQRGVIQAINNNTLVNPVGSTRGINPDATSQIFLDIQDRVLFDESELGMLGLAFHPDYESNGFFYVNYIADNPLRNVISRFTVSGEDPNQADPGSELILLEIEQPHPFHNGGQLVFGPEDGLLYIALGDGGPAGGVSQESKNLTNLLGSILRIDIDNPQGNLNYGIPPDNPLFGNTSGLREEIYAYGFRNPWRMSFDPVTGSLWTGDVGELSLEEIDIVEKAKNYGWPSMEGTKCFSPSSGCDMTGLELPIWEYGRNQGKSITGGFVYRGSDLSELKGKYIYGDFVSGRIWALSFEDGIATDNTELLKIADEVSFILTSFGVDEQNELYITGFDGIIYIIVEDNGAS